MCKLCRVALLCLCLLLLPAMSFGQAVYGSIVGTVTDSSGAALPHAKITIRDVGKGVSYNATTNDTGNYSQTHLIVGQYEVRIEATGFTTFVQPNISVEADAVATVNARLSVGSVGETVSVTAEAPLLKAE